MSNIKPLDSFTIDIIYILKERAYIALSFYLILIVSIY